MSVTKKEARAKEGIQSHFISRLRQAIPPGAGLAEELAEILEISIDSAYRRVRGETELTVNELYLITQKYPISLDDILSRKNNHIPFAYTGISGSGENYEEYLIRLADQLSRIARATHKKIYCVTNEVPLFHLFSSRKLAEFRIFHTQRDLLNIPEYQLSRFRYGLVPPGQVRAALRISKEYLNIPRVEIRAGSGHSGELKQMSRYFGEGLLDQDLFLDLVEEYHLMITRLHQQALEAPLSGGTELTLLQQKEDAMPRTGYCYALADKTRYTWLSFHTMHALMTNSPEFGEEAEQWCRIAERKSQVITRAGKEKVDLFFSPVYRDIEACKKRIHTS